MLLDHYRHGAAIGMMAGEVAKGKSCLEEGLSFVRDPSFVLIEHYHRPWNDSRQKVIEDGFRGGVQVTVNVEEGDIRGAVPYEMRQRLLEKSDMQGDSARGKVKLGGFSSEVKMAGLEIKPRLLKATKGIEGVEMGWGQFKEMIESPCKVHAELAVKTFILDFLDSEVGVRHPIIEGAG